MADRLSELVEADHVSVASAVESISSSLDVEIATTDGDREERSHNIEQDLGDVNENGVELDANANGNSGSSIEVPVLQLVSGEQTTIELIQNGMNTCYGGFDWVVLARRYTYECEKSSFRKVEYVKIFALATAACKRLRSLCSLY